MTPRMQAHLNSLKRNGGGAEEIPPLIVRETPEGSLEVDYRDFIPLLRKILSDDDLGDNAANGYRERLNREARAKVLEENSDFAFDVMANIASAHWGIPVSFGGYRNPCPLPTPTFTRGGQSLPYFIISGVSSLGCVKARAELRDRKCREIALRETATKEEPGMPTEDRDGMVWFTNLEDYIWFKLKYL